VIDMGQADRTLRHTPSGDNDGVFKRHRERMRRIEMKIKTDELQGSALDWAVAKCEGKGIEFDDPKDPWLTLDGIAYQPLHSYTPSTDWAQGGPIVEREKIGVWWATHYVDDDGVEYGNHWYAETGCTDENADGPYRVATGETPLIATMRCYVAMKLGDEVEIPEELR